MVELWLSENCWRTVVGSAVDEADCCSITTLFVSGPSDSKGGVMPTAASSAGCTLSMSTASGSLGSIVAEVTAGTLLRYGRPDWL